MNFKRPQREGTGLIVTTPLAGSMIGLLGAGLRNGPVVSTRTETTALNKLYGFKPEQPNERPPMPVLKVDPDAPHYKRIDAEKQHARDVAAWEKWEDPRPFMQAGADRNMARHAEADGLRLVAWLAKYVPAGGDPLKTLVQLAIDAGFDVDPEDVSWAEDES